MYMLILLGFWMLINYVYVDSNRFFKYLRTMYMLIPMNLIILGNYVHVDSMFWILSMCVDSTGFWMLVNYVYADSTEFWMLVNYVYADSTGLFESNGF